MKKLLIRLAFWILARYHLKPLFPSRIPIFDKQVATARALIAEQEIKHPDASGEYKRHMVYARLIKVYPRVRKRYLALAIETAICSE
jgi:hypothetical protein